MNSRRKQALENYYANPNHCRYCKKVIQIKDSDKTYDIKKKLFCNTSCSTKYLNPRKPKKKEYLRHLTKKDVFNEYKTYKSAGAYIRQDARKVFTKSGKPLSCCVCGYTHHIEIAHIQSVQNSDPLSTIAEINRIENLVALCPNHHWEFDNGILQL